MESPPRQSPFPALITWIIILSCVSFIMYRVAASYKSAAEKGITNPSSELQVQFIGKTAVGFDAMSGGGAATRPVTPFNVNGNAQQMIASMDAYASTPAEKVRTIVIIADLEGTDRALKRIDALESTRQTDAIYEDLAALRKIYTQGVVSLDDATRQELIAHHGFFGRLAVVQGLSPTDPARLKVIDEAKHSASLMIVMGVLALLLFGAIAISVITAIVLAALGMFKRLYIPTPSVNTAFLEAFAIWLVSFLLVSRVMAALRLESLAWEWCLLLLIPLTMAYVRGRAKILNASYGFGWYWGRGPLIEIPMGIFGYLAGVPVIVVGFVISIQLMKHAAVSPMHPIQKMLEGDWLHVLSLYGIACVFAPILEETMFRGALFNHLRRRWNWPISASIVALLFAAIHPQGWTLIPALGSIAVVLAALREWRGSLWAPIAAHATNNFVVLTLALLASR